MFKIIKKILPSFLPIALAITLLCGLFYLLAQQNYRQSANDPQIQIAEDIATQLDNGTPLQYYIPNLKIDISRSLGTFIFAYDGKGKLLGSSGMINGKQPEIPPGVFATTKQKGEVRVTWQPQTNTRIALVVVYHKSNGGGFVAIGRSLRETEIRIDNLTKIVFAGWIITLLAVFSLMVLQKKLD